MTADKEERLCSAMEQIAAAFKVHGVPVPMAMLREERRFQAAKAAMGGLLAGGYLYTGNGREREGIGRLAQLAIVGADALLAELAKEPGR